jgi:arylamine N-acetyltransferase
LRTDIFVYKRKIMIDAETHPLAQRDAYTDDQLASYLSALRQNLSAPKSLPAAFQDVHSLHKAARSSPLATLSTLMKFHLAAIPWGSLKIHYSPTHTLTLSPPDQLFNKLITRRFGGYCMEQNLFFSHILRSLGYEVYLTGARISLAVNAPPERTEVEKDGYMGFEHMVIFALINDGGQERKYVVDVGYGAFNALEPILLKECEECACQPGTIGRLVRRLVAASSLRRKTEMWVFQNKFVGKEDVGEEGWTNAYCFGEMEWFQTDFEVSNYRTSMDPTSWFRREFILTRMVARGERGIEAEGKGDAEIVGSVTFMGGNLTKRIGGGKSETIKECVTEQERVEMLREWFGIELSAEERESIRGWKSALKLK